MPVREAAKEVAGLSVSPNAARANSSESNQTASLQSEAQGDHPLTWASEPLPLETRKLTKHYPIARQKEKRIAVNALDLAVQTGEIFGFLGPNGAGKTTTIKILLGFTRSTSGHASLFGCSADDDSARSWVGYVPEQPYFPKFLTVLEVVRAHGALAGVPLSQMKQRTEKSLAMVRMSEHCHSPLSKLSKGMTQRVGLATALIGNPKLLIMDEPSSGLDPVGRKELRDLLLELKGQGKTIFLSSHLLSEIEGVCDRVGVLSQGKLVACGRPADIVQAKDEVTVEVSGTVDQGLSQQIVQWGGQVEPRLDGGCRLNVPTASVYPLLHLLEERSLPLLSVAPHRETLEDAFLRLVS